MVQGIIKTVKNVISGETSDVQQSAENVKQTVKDKVGKAGETIGNVKDSAK
jgi:hypothetical protein